MNAKRVHGVNRAFLAGVVLTLSVMALASTTVQGDVWEERDSAGRVRLRGHFEDNGDYVLAILDATGQESFKLMAPAAGGGVVSIGNAVTLESKGDGGVLVLRGKSGSVAKVSAEAGGSSMVLESGSGRVSMNSAEGGGRMEVSNDQAGIVWLSDRTGSKLFLGGRGSPGVEIRDDANGDRGIYVGMPQRTGRISMTQQRDGAVFLRLESSEHKPRLQLQGDSGLGSGIMLYYDSGAPAIKVGLRADGTLATSLMGPDGRELDVLRGSEPKK